jgi:undecaprenyl diphosphate synthase
MTVMLALSYSGRDDIVRMVKGVAADVAAGSCDPGRIDEQWVAARLDTRGIPDPDLLIRTSGEMRVSNFLLWQISYAELVVTQTLWPDFRKKDLFEALEEFTRRHRRFGGL